MSYILRTEQMTLEEIKAKSADNFVEEIIAVPLQTLLDNDFVGNMDVEYMVVGNGADNEVHLKVNGYADLIDS